MTLTPEPDALDSEFAEPLNFRSTKTTGKVLGQIRYN